MKRIDITGPLSNQMWEYGKPFPKIVIRVEKGHTDGFGDFSFTSINGLHSLSGTYLETPAHYKGYDKSFLIETIPVESLMDRPCVVLNVDIDIYSNKKQCITLNMLKNASNSGSIKEGDAILVGTGWGNEKWFSKEHFPMSPYFSKEAFTWLLDHNPAIIGSDTSCWDNLSDPSGLFDDFYERGILMLGGLRNLCAVTSPRVKLTVLPLLLENSCASPCRVIISED